MSVDEDVQPMRMANALDEELGSDTDSPQSSVMIMKDDIDSEDIDEILEIVGIDKREKFLESMKKFE